MPWRVRVHDAEGRLRGGGALLGAQHVLTCAHVIDAEDNLVLVEFVGSPEIGRLSARVAREDWVPVGDDGRGDLALLKLDQPVDAALGTFLRRVPAPWGRDVRIYGFPQDADYGIWVRARLAGPSGPGGEWIQVDNPDARIGMGFSGCPVIDGATGRPLGIMVTTLPPDGPAWMIPTDVIVRYLPRVSQWVTDTSVLDERLDQLVVRAGGVPGTADDELRVSLPKGAMPGPTELLLEDPAVPESRRYCGNCDRPVGRGRPGFDALDRGFCENCGTRFDFTPALLAGDLVADRYMTLGSLSHGGFSSIYLARDSRGGGLVVLKSLIRGIDRAVASLAAGQRDVLSRLEHPNLVRMFGYVEHADRVTGQLDSYLVMEYVQGLSLRAVMRQAKRLRPEHVATYGLRILDALGYLHSRGLLYGDMKPDNVMQVGDQVKVIDLGAVRSIDDRTSVIIGTQRYQPAREELERHGVTVRSDLFAVGMTLSELLDSCESVTPSLGTDALEALIARATSGYEDRFVSAQDMAEQLQGVLRQLLSLRDRIPRPVASTVFTGSARLLQGGLRLPSWEEWPEGATGPVLRCDAPPASAEVAAALPRLLPERADLPASSWNRALTQLEVGDVAGAALAVRTCTSAVPGEPAVWLAAAACAELQGDIRHAERYFDAVWSRDRGEISAAFGLARTRLGSGDRVGAAAVLDDVQEGTGHVVEARVAAILALAARPGADLDPPSPDEVAAALQRLPSAGLHGESLDRLTAIVLEAALELVATQRVRPAQLPNERELRTQLRRTYREAARTRKSKTTWESLLDRAHRVFDASLRRPAEPELVVSQNKYLAADQEEMHVVVTITAGGQAGLVLRVRTTPGQRLELVRQVSPTVVELPVEPETPIGLGQWAPGESRDYLLRFTAERRGPLDVDFLLATVYVEGADGRSAGRPVVAHWTTHAIDPPEAAVARYTGTGDLLAAIEAALAAYESGDAGEALDALGAAVAMAAQQGNEAVLRRLSQLVDIVDAENGLVSLRGTANDFERDEWDYLSERLSVPLRYVELAGAGLATGVRTSVRILPSTAQAPPGVLPPREDVSQLGWSEPGPGAPPILRASVRCLSDGEIVVGRPVGVSVAVHRAERLEPLREPVCVRVLLDAAPGRVEPVTRVAWLSVDRHLEPVEFEVTPVRPGPLRLVFRIYRDFDSHLLLEVAAALLVERTEVPS